MNLFIYYLFFCLFVLRGGGGTSPKSLGGSVEKIINRIYMGDRQFMNRGIEEKEERNITI